MDQQWVAVERVVQAALTDRQVVTNPPQTPEDWSWLSATITDHICAAFNLSPRPKG